jgi:hypothetical protein
MKLTVAACAAILLVSTAPAATTTENPEAAAEAAATAWLALVDAGNYARSWSDASAFFRERVPEAKWQSEVGRARAPFGALKSRKVESATLKHELPGVPDGAYVVIRFASSFEHKASAIETVTPMKGADGNWRVSGYYMK